MRAFRNLVSNQCLVLFSQARGNGLEALADPRVGI